MPRLLRARTVIGTLLRFAVIAAPLNVVAQQLRGPVTEGRVSQPLPPINRQTPEIVVLAFTSATCPWAQRDSFRIALERVVTAVRAYADQQPTKMRTVVSGASIDESTEVGLAALRKLGSFNEISVGRGWLNSQVIRFGFRDFRAEVGTPSVVVYTRNVMPRQSTIDVGPDAVIDRGFGADGILALHRRIVARAGPFALRAVQNPIRAGARQ